MQLLKNIVTNGLIVLGLSFGLTILASAQDDSFDYAAAAEAAVVAAEADIAAAQLDFSELDIDTLGFYADIGNAVAQYNLGVRYAFGKGVRQDHKKAFEWYQKSANQKNSKAQYNLGVAYSMGEGVRQNKITAKEWFGKSCDNGLQLGCDEYRKLNEKGN